MSLSDLLAGGGFPAAPTDPEYGNLVERDAPADLDFKKLLAGRGKQFQRDEFVSRPVDVSNTETSRAMVSPGTPQPDPGSLRDPGPSLEALQRPTPGVFNAMDPNWLPGRGDQAAASFGPDGVYRPSNPARQELMDAASRRLLHLVRNPHELPGWGESRAQEMANLTSFLRGAEAQSWQEQAGADIPDERRARVETARARAAKARAEVDEITNPRPRAPIVTKFGRGIAKTNPDTSETTFEQVPAWLEDGIASGDIYMDEVYLLGAKPGLADKTVVARRKADGKVLWKAETPGTIRTDIGAQIASAAGREGVTAPADERKAAASELNRRLGKLDSLATNLNMGGTQNPEYAAQAKQILDDLAAFGEKHRALPPGVTPERIKALQKAAAKQKAVPSARQR